MIGLIKLADMPFVSHFISSFYGATNQGNINFNHKYRTGDKIEEIVLILKQKGIHQINTTSALL